MMEVEDQEEQPAPDELCLASIHFTKIKKKSYFQKRIKQPKKQLEEKRTEGKKAEGDGGKKGKGKGEDENSQNDRERGGMATPQFPP